MSLSSTDSHSGMGATGTTTLLTTRTSEMRQALIFGTSVLSDARVDTLGVRETTLTRDTRASLEQLMN